MVSTGIHVFYIHCLLTRGVKYPIKKSITEMLLNFKTVSSWQGWHPAPPPLTYIGVLHCCTHTQTLTLLHHPFVSFYLPIIYYIWHVLFISLLIVLSLPPCVVPSLYHRLHPSILFTSSQLLSALVPLPSRLLLRSFPRSLSSRASLSARFFIEL